MENKYKVFYLGVACWLFLSFSIGAIVGDYNYQHQINKCNNLRGSDYEFNIDAQINANYAESCFYYKEHPFAHISSIVGFGFLFLLLGFVVGLIPAIAWMSYIDYGY